MKAVFCLSVLIISLLTGTQTWAQKKVGVPSGQLNKKNEPVEAYQVGLLAKGFGDSVVVRWVPNKADLFRAGLTGGYLLTRRTLQDDLTQTVDFQVVVRPWPVPEWRKKADTRDSLAAACAQLVNGHNTPLKYDEALTLDKIMQQQNQTDLRMALSLILADLKPLYAEGMALGFVDRKVKPGEKYTYSVKSLADPVSFPVPVSSTAVVNRADPSDAPMPAVVPGSGDRTIVLSWDRELAEANFSGYFVEKSNDGGKTFTRLNRVPWLQPAEGPGTDAIVYTDSVAENYRPYHYRVLGITPFGELAQSNVVTAAGTDKTPPPPVFGVKATFLKGRGVKVTWQYDTPPPDLSGFIVGRSNRMEGPFTPVHEKLLPAGQREMTDPLPDTAASCYYKIVTIDTARNVSDGLPVSCFISNTAKPSRPKNLQGYIDSTGLLRIVWDANPETDLYGYKVLYANAPEHPFIFKTPDYLAIPGYNDSLYLNTLTKRICFKVVAYNKRFQASEPSEILILYRPDLVAPAPPAIRHYELTDSTLTLQWNASPDHDVKEQLILRRGKASERWQPVGSVDARANTFTDRDLKGDSEYGYAIVAVDSAGLRSAASFPLNIRTSPSAVQPVEAIRIFVNPDKSVSLYWNYNVPNCRFTIYKAGESGQMRSLDAVYDKREYRDQHPSKGVSKYVVRVTHQNGRASRFSSVVEVNIP